MELLTLTFFLLAVCTALASAIRPKTQTHLIALTMAVLAFLSSLLDEDLMSSSALLLVTAANFILILLAGWQFMFSTKGGKN